MELNTTNIKYQSKSKSSNDFKHKKKLTKEDIDIVNKNINKDIIIPGFSTNFITSKLNQIELTTKNINRYTCNDIRKIFGIDFDIDTKNTPFYEEDPNKKMLIKEMTDEIMDELLNEIGNYNYGKRTLRLKNPKDRLNEYSSVEDFSKNFITYGFDKENVDRHHEVSFDKDNKDFICNFANITYNLTSKGYINGQYDLCNSLGDTLNVETRQKCFDFISRAINETYANKVLSTNDIKTIKNVLNRKFRINTRYSKVITIDCDFENSLEGSIKKRFIFYILRFFKFAIAENKDIYKRNHFTIVLFLSNFYDMKFITTIRNLFKIAGICDKGHSTVFGKNIFNTKKYNVYYNKYGKYLDKNLDEFYNSVIGRCFDANKLMFENLGININKSNIKEDEDYIKADSLLSINRQQNGIELIDFSQSNEFINFAESRGLTFEPKIKKEIVLEYGKNEEYNNYSIGLDRFKEDFNNGKIESVEDLYKYKIILKGDFRKRNVGYIGFKLGRLSKTLNLTLKKIIEIFNTIVSIDGKYDKKEMEQKLIEGYHESFVIKRYHVNEDGKSFEQYQLYLGNISHNSRRCMRIMKSIVKDIIKLINKNKKDDEIESYISKKHRTYKQFIKNAIKIIRNGSFDELNNNLKEYMKTFLYSHILSYGFENFKLHNDDTPCCYAIKVDKEFDDFYSSNVENYINKFMYSNSKEKIKPIHIINKTLNTLKQVVYKNTFMPLRI